MNRSRSRRHTERLLLLLLVAAAAALVGCSKDKKIMAPIVPATETISTPVVPSGDSVVTPGAIYGATTGGASSSLGHSLEYRMDFDAGGAHRYSSWSSDSVTFQAWPAAGSYLVEAEARCATHPSVASAWSAGRRVTVAGALQELISVPNIPSGDTAPALGATASYSTGGAISYLGHALEYRFHLFRVDGDGTPSDEYSGWSSSTTLSHTWPRCAGAFQVVAQARCAIHTDQVSQPSSPLTVRVTGSGAIVVISASIQFLEPFTDHDAGAPMHLSRALAPWSEGGVTWANKPAISASWGRGVRTAVDNDYITGTLMTFAIPLDLLQAWRDDPSSNYGLAVSDSNATSPGFDSDVDFYARMTGAGEEPTVSIVWQYPGEDCQHVKSIPLQQDAYVDESAPASNFGAATPLLAGSLGGKERAIFVRFDPSLP